MSFPFLSNPILRESLAISLGAIPGALSRYYLTIFIKNILPIGFPYGTLLVNITGSFLMGIFIAVLSARILTVSPELILFITVGFLGAYTTFSTYELDSIKLLEQGNKQLMVLYWLGSPILGLISIQLGITLVKSIDFLQKSRE